MDARKLLLLSALSAALPALAQEVTFKIAHFLPSATPAQQKVLEPWCDSPGTSQRC